MSEDFADGTDTRSSVTEELQLTLNTYGTKSHFSFDINRPHENGSAREKEILALTIQITIRPRLGKRLTFLASSSFSLTLENDKI